MATDFYDEKSEEQPKKTTKGSTTPVLDNFSNDFTELAKKGKIETVVGRDKEVRRIVQILSRKKKNNTMIVGEPGVGKTALIEKLALLIVGNDCPPELSNKRVVGLDLTSLIAGTKYRGQFEERMKVIMKELKENPDVITFIDEIHIIMGAGNSSGSMDVDNLLKPALARGEMQCIGATTFEEYKKNIEKDGSLERRFQKIILSEPSVLETNIILNKIKGDYESFHNVSYGEDVIKTIVDLADQYITDRQFPDKALDVMDELGSNKKINFKEPEIIGKLKGDIEKVKKAKAQVVIEQDYQNASILKNKEDELKTKLDKELDNWKESLRNNKEMVTVENVYQIMTEITGIPINKLDKKEMEKLLNFEKELKERVVGQDDAISVISKSIRRNRVGVRDKNKPLGSFMFIGETGVGKTHLVKTLSEKLFGEQGNIIRLDMSEYMDKHNVSKLIGSPPGFVGYEEGGQLTEKVKNNPFSIILFDEIEKAHKDIFNIMLQILDEGHLTDSFGKKVNFKNTIIIMTSNVGTKRAKDFGNGLGFSSSSEVQIEKNKKEIIEKDLKVKFAPEFLNRIDDIVFFNKLKEEDFKKIIDIEIGKTLHRINERNYNISVDKTLSEEVFKRNKDDGYGARPIKRIIQKLIEDYISEEILMGNIKETFDYVLKYDEKIYH